MMSQSADQSNIPSTDRKGKGFKPTDWSSTNCKSPSKDTLKKESNGETKKESNDETKNTQKDDDIPTLNDDIPTLNAATQSVAPVEKENIGLFDQSQPLLPEEDDEEDDGSFYLNQSDIGSESSLESSFSGSSAGDSDGASFVDDDGIGGGGASSSTAKIDKQNEWKDLQDHEGEAQGERVELVSEIQDLFEEIEEFGDQSADLMAGGLRSGKQILKRKNLDDLVVVGKGIGSSASGAAGPSDAGPSHKKR